MPFGPISTIAKGNRPACCYLKLKKNHLFSKEIQSNQCPQHQRGWWVPCLLFFYFVLKDNLQSGHCKLSFMVKKSKASWSEKDLSKIKQGFLQQNWTQENKNKEDTEVNDAKFPMRQYEGGKTDQTEGCIMIILQHRYVYHKGDLSPFSKTFHMPILTMNSLKERKHVCYSKSLFPILKPCDPLNIFFSPEVALNFDLPVKI